MFSILQIIFFMGASFLQFASAVPGSPLVLRNGNHPCLASWEWWNPRCHKTSTTASTRSKTSISLLSSTIVTYPASTTDSATLTTPTNSPTNSTSDFATSTMPTGSVTNPATLTTQTDSTIPTTFSTQTATTSSQTDLNTVTNSLTSSLPVSDPTSSPSSSPSPTELSITISTDSITVIPISSSYPASSAQSTYIGTPISSTDWWKPTAGAKWQIEISNPVTQSDINLPVEAFDLDVFDNDPSTISALHSNGRKVICYFSAGTYESWRPDASSFNTADLGGQMQDWSGEWWINTNSQGIRDIMQKRITLAQQKGCDAIDPDNVDAYNNAEEQLPLKLTENDAVNYTSWLADTAHGMGLAMGLKNALEIVSQVLPKMEFQVNEQCVINNECDTLTQFTDNGKPVFHIEYPYGTQTTNPSSVSSAVETEYCNAPKQFSSVLKTMGLDSWVYTC